MIRFTFRSLALLALLLLTAVALAACGGDNDKDTDATSDSIAKKTDAGRLTHGDGSIKLDGDTLTLSPAAGGAAVVLKLGPAVAQGTVQALVSTNARARVFYNPTSKDDELIAVSVQPAPTAGADAMTYDGEIVNVSEKIISIKGNDGTKTFQILEKDLPSFDIPHLEEHQDEQSPVRVYYEGEGGDTHAVAYEDA